MQPSWPPHHEPDVVTMKLVTQLSLLVWWSSSPSAQDALSMGFGFGEPQPPGGIVPDTNGVERFTCL